jgi:glycosyltransferase involved in cell wall biosynthesis
VRIARQLKRTGFGLVGGRMTRHPVISVITPAYNVAEFLPETVASALAQTWHDFEMLIVDDGSTDNTQQIARSWERADPRIRVFTQENRGPSAARNKAIVHARGEYFALLDGDDLWHPTFLESQMRLFSRKSAVDVVTGNAYNLGGTVNGRPFNPAGTTCRELSLLNILESEASVFIMSIFRRAVIDRVGAFDDRLRTNEDYDLWIRAAHAGFVFVQNPVPLGHYRRRPGSASANEIQMFTGILRVFHRASALCADRPRELAAIQKQIERFEGERFLASAKAHLVGRNFDAAARDFSSLFNVRRDFASAAIAQMSRYMPSILLWAYRIKRGLNRRARASVTVPPSVARRGHDVAFAEVHHDDRA